MNIAKEPSEVEDSSFYKGKVYLNVLPTLGRYGITFLYHYDITDY